MALAPRTLKGQLTFLFLLLTLVPALALTLFSARQIVLAVARWETPGVRQALTGGLEVAQNLLEQAHSDLRQRGQLLAADPVLDPPLDAESVRNRLATSYNLDFLQIYGPGGELQFEATRDPLVPAPLPLGKLDPSALDIREDRDQSLVAYVGYWGPPGDTVHVMVTGIYLNESLYPSLDELSQAVGYYLQLPAYISLQQKTKLGLLGLLVLLLAGFSVWVARRLAARVSRPVVALGNGMEAVARGEDAVRVGPEGTEEMERLILTFNQMSAELSRSRHRLAQAERLAAWRDVARRVAHEIKNALTPITFAAHRLRKATGGGDSGAGPDPARVAPALDTVLEEVEGLRRLAASFSELARLPLPELNPLDVTDLARGVVEGFAGGTTPVRWQAPEEPVMVDADRTLLRQALTNLVKNGVESTGDRGEVRVRVEEDEGRVALVVEDDGPGWPEGMRGKAIEPYVTTKPDGTGLGLSLVQRTALQHGGTLELGEGPGGGARVVLQLPRAGGTGRAADTAAPKETS